MSAGGGGIRGGGAGRRILSERGGEGKRRLWVQVRDVRGRVGGSGVRGVRREGAGGGSLAIGRQGGEAFEVGQTFDEAVAFFAVGDDQVFDGDRHIVAQDLPEDLLVEDLAHCFAFDEHPGLGAFVEDHQVEAFGELTQFHFSLYGNI